MLNFDFNCNLFYIKLYNSIYKLKVASKPLDNIIHDYYKYRLKEKIRQRNDSTSSDALISSNKVKSTLYTYTMQEKEQTKKLIRSKQAMLHLPTCTRLSEEIIGNFAVNSYGAKAGTSIVLVIHLFPLPFVDLMCPSIRLWKTVGHTYSFRVRNSTAAYNLYVDKDG